MTNLILKLRSRTAVRPSAGAAASVLVADWPRRLRLVLLAAAVGVIAGCGTGGEKQAANQNFFTSGNPQADQRASQRMAKAQQLSGKGQGGTSDNDQQKNAKPAAGKPAQAQGKMSLFDRLGGEKGVTAIVDNFTPRLLQDPRVNWDRKGVKRSGLFHHGPSVTWNPTPDAVAKLKQHMIEFLELATGGPAHYQGREIESVHAGMAISNAEFDAVVGDIKASLDNLQIANQEQKELLAIIESTRPEIVTQR